MKILFVIEWFYQGSGTVQTTYNISKEFSKLGHEVTIITSNYKFDDKFAESLNDYGVKILKFEHMFSFRNFVFSPSMKKWLKINIKEFDIIHLQNFRSYQNIVTSSYAKKFNKPYVLQAHGSVLPFFQRQILKKIFDNIWGYKILNGASKIISLTKTETKQYIKMGVNESKIEVIPNGIDISQINYSQTEGSFKERYSIENKKLVLYLGRIDKIKGIEMLINSFLEVQKKINDVILIIAGPENDYLDYLKKLSFKLGINEEIIFTGPLYGKDKFEAYSDADIYVLPSFYETFPMTVLEALACSTPVIITENCGISNIIQEYHVGFVVKYEKEDLSKALIKMLSEPQLKEKFCKNCENLVKNQFNLINVVKKLEKVFNDT